VQGLRLVQQLGLVMTQQHTRSHSKCKVKPATNSPQPLTYRMQLLPKVTNQCQSIVGLKCVGCDPTTGIQVAARGAGCRVLKGILVDAACTRGRKIHKQGLCQNKQVSIFSFCGNGHASRKIAKPVCFSVLKLPAFWKAYLVRHKGAVWVHCDRHALATG